jgi:hypothetical protein
VGEGVGDEVGEGVTEFEGAGVGEGAAVERTEVPLFQTNPFLLLIHLKLLFL